MAATWQEIFARSFQTPIGGGARTALFLTAWLIYLADRLVDSLSLGNEMPMSLRQAFCRRHRRAWSGAIALIAAVDAAVILRWLHPDLIGAGAVCGIATVGYLVVNATSKIWRVFPIKEVTIGVLFAIGTVLAPALAVRAITFPMVGSFGLFAVLASMNCLTIADWERELDCSQRKISAGTEFSSLARTVFVGCLLTTGLAGAMAVREPATRAVFIAIAIAAISLCMLGRFGDRLRPDVRTALADLALLTPLVGALLP